MGIYECGAHPHWSWISNYYRPSFSWSVILKCIVTKCLMINALTMITPIWFKWLSWQLVLVSVDGCLMQNLKQYLHLVSRWFGYSLILKNVDLVNVMCVLNGSSYCDAVTLHGTGNMEKTCTIGTILNLNFSVFCPFPLLWNN